MQDYINVMKILDTIPRRDRNRETHHINKKQTFFYGFNITNIYI